MNIKFMKINSVPIQSYGPKQGITGSRVMCASVHLISHKSALRSTGKNKGYNRSREYTSCKTAQTRFRLAHCTMWSSRQIHCLIHVNRRQAISSLFLHLYSEVWCSVLCTENKTGASFVWLSESDTAERREHGIHFKIFIKKHYYDWLLFPLFLIMKTGFTYGSLQNKKEKKRNNHSGTSGACDALNINKGAILQCITVLLRFILQDTDVIAEYRVYWGCFSSAQLLTLLEALFHLKLKSIIFQSIDDLL